MTYHPCAHNPKMNYGQLDAVLIYVINITNNIPKLVSYKICIRINKIRKIRLDWPISKYVPICTRYPWKVTFLAIDIKLATTLTKLHDLIETKLFSPFLQIQPQPVTIFYAGVSPVVHTISMFGQQESCRS